MTGIPTRLCLALASTLCLLTLAAGARAPLTFEERVKAQEAIERVYHARRIWPAENKRPKPAFEEAVPRAVLEAKVAEGLKKSAALEALGHRALSPEQLQAELDRMGRGSKDPGLLRELLTALGDDPHLAAECLARPALADRLLRGAYASEERFHGAVRERARLLTAAPPESADLGGVDVQRLTFIPSASERDEAHAGTGGTARVPLSPGEFARRRAEFPPPGAPPAIHEEEERIAVVRTLSTGPESLEVEYWVLPKRTFAEWWACEGVTIAPRLPALSTFAFRLPRVEDLPTCEDAWQKLPENTPSPRGNHTMVWTGSEVVIWGGADGSYRSNVGGRYSPATDTWLATSTAGACPTGRDSHTAVWTGSEMIVWGGWDGTNYRRDGSRYDPVTDSWTALSEGGGCPTPRMWHSAVWTGSTMIVWGGYNGNNLSSGGIYTPAEDLWVFTPAQATTPYARWGHAAVWTGTEMLVWGGYLGGGLFAQSGARFNPAANLWTTMAEGEFCPPPRRDMSYAWTGSELLVWGGYAGVCVGSGGRYSPASDTWAPMASQGAPSARTSFPSAPWTGSEMIVWGGFCGFDMAGDGARYNPSQDLWTPIGAGTAPPARRWHRAVWAGEEMVVWGGDDGHVSLDSGSRYDPATGGWTPTPIDLGAPSARERHTAVWTGAELIVWGGFVVDGTGWHELNSGGAYSPATDGWTATSEGTDCPIGRYGHSAVWTGEEMILWAGHRYANGLDLDVASGGRYEPVSMTWAETSGVSVPAPRNSHAAAWSGEAMVVWGGYQVGGGYPYPLGDGGRYYPATDTWHSVAQGEDSPAPRVVPGVWTGTHLLIWGGGSLETHYADGGLYDPATDSWTPIPESPDGPSPRKYPWSVWTGDALLVWGGKGDLEPDGTYKNTGGLWSPSRGAWRPTSTAAGCPAGRDFFVGVAPWSGKELLVWGGADALSFFGDGARYNPSTDAWHPMATALAPPARNRHTTTWCGSNLIVFGGLGPNAYERTGAVYTVRPGTLTCSASASPSAGTAPLTVDFASSALPDGCTGSATYAWEFGDGSLSDQPAPEHRYELPGTYAWSVTVTVNGVPCTASGSIAVAPPCDLTCGASAEPASGVAPLAVQFAGSVQSQDCTGAATFEWAFGDGGTSDLQNPNHTYAAAGTYSWTLTVSQGGATCTRQGTVTAVPPCVLTCAPEADPASGTAPLSVTFSSGMETSHCTGVPTFSWAFGDGAASDLEGPLHTYASPGSYTWTLTVTLEGETCTQTGTVTVAAPCVLSCSASATPSSGQAPLAVTFSALSAATGCDGEPSYLWSFGDGVTSPEQNPQHTYASPGSYDWSLTVSQGGQSCTKTGSVTATVSSVPGDCDGDGSVSIGEVQKAINMFLGLLPPGCGADCNGDGSVSIGEVQKVINAFLGLATEC